MQSCWDGQVIRGRGFDLSLTKGCSTEASSLIKEVPGGAGVGTATLDIQFKITCLRMIFHLCTFILISDLPYQTV